MKVVSKTGDPKFATVYVAKMRDNPKALIEFVDAVDPRYSREEKWVIIVSTQIGCPIGCLMCDSGSFFWGNLTKDEILTQIDHIFSDHQPLITCHCFSSHPKLKIQFARMGEPALNPAVLDVLEELPRKYPIKGLMPCIATTAPAAAASWFERLAEIKNKYYAGGNFQLQFSINSTDEPERDRLMPIRKWPLDDISKYGEKFFRNGDRKITLNFALADDFKIDADILAEKFNPKKFLVKITPINPTEAAKDGKFRTVISPEKPYSADMIAGDLDKRGFETIISIGSSEEIKIGSNCGQSARKIRGKENYGRHNLDGGGLERRHGI